MVKDQIINRYQVLPDKIQVVYSGVDNRQLNPDLKKQKDYFKKELQIDKDTLTLLFMGNGFERKGLACLIEAVAHMRDRIPITVLVAGIDKKAEYFKKIAADAGCSEKIQFLGYQTDVASLYSLPIFLYVLPFLIPLQMLY